jgi:hypothetical protein
MRRVDECVLNAATIKEPRHKTAMFWKYRTINPAPQEELRAGDCKAGSQATENK